jgi:hypothetical protein
MASNPETFRLYVWLVKREKLYTFKSLKSGKGPGLKAHPKYALFQGAEQLAEKVIFRWESNEKKTAGAKAQHLFCCICGSQG